MAEQDKARAIAVLEKAQAEQIKTMAEQYKARAIAVLEKARTEQLTTMQYNENPPLLPRRFKQSEGHKQYDNTSSSEESSNFQ